MSPDFTLAPQTSVSAAVKAESIQLDRIEAKLDQLIKALEAKES